MAVFPNLNRFGDDPLIIVKLMSPILNNNTEQVRNPNMFGFQKVDLVRNLNGSDFEPQLKTWLKIQTKLRDGTSVG